MYIDVACVLAFVVGADSLATGSWFQRLGNGPQPLYNYSSYQYPFGLKPNMRSSWTIDFRAIASPLDARKEKKARP